ncbi:MAG: eight-cysteine-cluster domain-containing protein [Candidatus Aenigmarchaeota archaeon]|nr:eight-cysteine-cluster domain-containing protein [Candidatus Aenigmarchaeota archaeon]
MHLKLEIAGAIVIIIVLVGAFFYLRPDILGIMAEKEPAPVIECTMNTDCAPAGCSNQICATAEKAPTIITTCEFRDEWECLAKTSCGCVKNKCAWKDNPEYQQCMEKFKG